MIAKRATGYREIIAECFAEDEPLINKWHLEAGKGLEACAEATYRDMRDAGVDFFEVTEKGERVGYFGRELFRGNEFLTGFFVRPKFREKKFMRRFWQLVSLRLASPFYCGLYEKNEPAIAFINKNNGKEVARVESRREPAVFFKVD